jgi:hypothetical protein
VAEAVARDEHPLRTGPVGPAELVQLEDERIRNSPVGRRANSGLRFRAGGSGLVQLAGSGAC